ncbi:MAG: M28 family peptidase [Candidatus Lokiarchaeota archaeon]|nr:M28 family peptidase [Candidatus Harpocratesius repetitus]
MEIKNIKSCIVAILLTGILIGNFSTLYFKVYPFLLQNEKIHAQLSIVEQNYPFYSQNPNSASSFSTLNEEDLLLINSYNESNVYDMIAQQIDFGYRIPSSNASDQCISWISSTMKNFTNVSIYPFTLIRNQKEWLCKNIIAKYNEGKDKILIFAAHFDSRAVAEKDPDESRKDFPIEGANDGASGVAVLMEIARLISQSEVKWDYEFWFLFLDAEDQGLSLGRYGLPNFSWCEGSSYLVNDMKSHPDNYFSANQSLNSIKSFILLDMVGGEDLEFIHESHSSPDLQDRFFKVGNHIGYTQTFPLEANSYSILDDHVSFSREGIPTLDLIIKFWDPSITWSYHHTHGDNLEHISKESLKIIGKTLMYFIYFTYHPSLEGFSADFSSPSFFQENWQSLVLISVGIIAIGIYIFFRMHTKRIKITRMPS